MNIVYHPIYTVLNFKLILLISGKYKKMNINLNDTVLDSYVKHMINNAYNLNTNATEVLDKQYKHGKYFNIDYISSHVSSQLVRYFFSDIK